MLKKIKTTELQAFDMAGHLQTDEVVGAYLTLVLNEDDPSELAHALGKALPCAWFE